MSDEPDRIKIWNSYLLQARDAAQELTHPSSGNYPSLTLDGNHLSHEQHFSLMAILYSVLAIEARANHLIHELHEKRLISKQVRNAATRLNTKHKWFLLPTLAGRSSSLQTDSPPHRSVAALCKFRNEFVHVKFDRRIIRDIPPQAEVVKLYNHWVEAMEDMNVVLGRHALPDEGIITELRVNL